MLLVVNSVDGTVCSMTVRTPVVVFILTLAVTLAALSSLYPKSSARLQQDATVRDSIKFTQSTHTLPAPQDEVILEKSPLTTIEPLEHGTQYLHGSQKSRVNLVTQDEQKPLPSPSLYSGGTGAKIATVSFWERLAYCETHADWENTGRYAGGLGIYIGTWRQWGGTQFAHHPSEATKSEQILVANRISTQGWLRPDGSFQRPVWFTGWGALSCAGRPELVTLDDPDAYTLEHSRMTQ